MPLLPATLGLDCSGVVLTFGSGVAKVRPGQLVVTIGIGCFAEYMEIEDDWAFPLSDRPYEMDEAAALWAPN